MTRAEKERVKGLWEVVERALNELDEVFLGANPLEANPNDFSEKGSLWRKLLDERATFVKKRKGQYERARRPRVTWEEKFKREQQRGEVYRACGVLGMTPPDRDGQPVDLELAARQKKQLAFACHPDIVGPGREEQFRSLCEAYKTLQALNIRISERRAAAQEARAAEERA